MENIEQKIIELVATDRLDIPISSMSGKLKRQKPKLAQAIDLSESEGEYYGDRVYARTASEDTMKARGMKDAIEEFSSQYPRHGDILKGMIAEQRAVRETSLYFGVNPGCRLTSDDYMSVMESLGFSQATAERLYPELLETSRTISKRKSRAEEERSILIG